MPIRWTDEELEEMRRADEEIEAELGDDFFFDPTIGDLDKELDQLAKNNDLSHRELWERERNRRHARKYYALHREEILANKKNTGTAIQKSRKNTVNPTVKK